LNVIDSSAWIEYLQEGRFAGTVETYLVDADLLVPTVVIYEVYKFARREGSEQLARRAVMRMKQGTVVPLDESLAMEAAEVSLERHLHFADAVVYASAQRHGALLVTGDQHFAGLPGGECLAGEETSPTNH
jgi:predicted nucleic acid-binding protein